MIKETIKYTDLNGNERVEDVYFHVTGAQLLDLQMLTPGKNGYGGFLEELVKSNDTVEIYKQVTKLIRLAYGVKTDDGKSFIKSEEATNAFLQTELYNQFIMNLFADAEKNIPDFISRLYKPAIDEMNRTIDKTKPAANN